MAEFKDFTFESSTGKNTIHARKCVPTGEVKGVVQIAHGIAEHINRYDEFMAFLANNGFVAVGNDHLGHGQSYSTPEEKGIFSRKGGWSYVVSDMLKLHDIMIQEYPNVKYIMFGHSMGSFLTRTYMIEHPESYDLAILSGTGHMKRAVYIGGCAIADFFSRREGLTHSGDKLEKVAFGKYEDRITNPRTEYDWLSTVDEEVDKYIADDNCGFTCKNSLYRDMMHAFLLITSKKKLAKMDKSKPVYFMSGKEDPVGEYGAGVERAYQAFCNVGMQDVTVKLYEGGRHEMLNEKNKAQVMDDILFWINSKL